MRAKGRMDGWLCGRAPYWFNHIEHQLTTPAPKALHNNFDKIMMLMMMVFIGLGLRGTQCFQVHADSLHVNLYENHLLSSKVC